MRENPFTKQLFEHRTTEKKKLYLSLAITALVMVIEVIGGILTNSIALISDAGHMFTHCFALSISIVAITISKKPPCHHRTFGLYRAEILAAFVNGIFLIIVVAVIIYEAVIRIINPREILELQMFIIAIIGLLVNIASILILYGSHKSDINIKSVFYHMLADAASSVGIIITAIIIYYSGWSILDPLVSIGISIIILRWAWNVLRESAVILLEMAPTGLTTEIIENELKSKFSEIKDIYNVHLWTITADMYVFTAHIKIHNPEKSTQKCIKLLKEIDKYLSEKYGIIESTLQISY